MSRALLRSADPPQPAVGACVQLEETLAGPWMRLAAVACGVGWGRRGVIGRVDWECFGCGGMETSEKRFGESAVRVPPLGDSIGPKRSGHGPLHPRRGPTRSTHDLRATGFRAPRRFGAQSQAHAGAARGVGHDDSSLGGAAAVRRRRRGRWPPPPFAHVVVVASPAPRSSRSHGGTEHGWVVCGGQRPFAFSGIWGWPT